MAEALAVVGLASSILTFVTAGTALIARLRDSAEELSGYAVFKEIAAQLPLMIEIVQRIDQERSDGSIDTDAQQSLMRVVYGCERQIYLLGRLMEELLPTSSDSRMMRARKAFGSIYKEKKVMEIQRALETYKTTLTLHFSQISGQKNGAPAIAEREVYCEIPSWQVSHFVGREELLGAIDDHMNASRNSGPATVVLFGMGGQGKTQLALEYCRRQAGRYRAILWIDATSPHTVARSFGTIANKISKSKRVFSDEEAKISFVKDTLETWSSWLLVFDNFDDPSAFKDIKAYFPKPTKGGAFLVTSRHMDSERLGNVVAVRGMTEDEGMDFLFQRSRQERNGESAAYARAIVQRLGCLPLAIDQAGGYIRARRLPFSMFMEHYDNRRETVLKITPELWEYRKRLAGGEDETSMSVFTTWEMCFAQIGGSDRGRDSIRHLLALSAFLNTANATEDIFKTLFLATRSSPPEWMEILTTNGNWDSFKFHDTIADLSKLSLIQSVDFRGSRCHFSIHPLIRDWVRLRLDLQCRKEFVVEAVMAVTHLIDAETNPSTSLQQKREIVSQIDACIQNDAEFLDWENQLGSERMRYPAIKFGIFYNTQGRYKDAELMFGRILERYERGDWPKFPDTLSASMNLANVYRNQGQYKEAEALYKVVLDSNRDELPADHPDTLYTTEGLAIVYTAQGRHKEAEDLYRQVLDKREKQLGLDHIDVFRTVEGLSNVYRIQSKFRDAEELCKRALDGYTTQLGPDHPDTLRTIESLAIIYRNRGRYDEAEALYESSLQGYETQFGPNHPYTLRLIMNLAIVYEYQYRYEEAEALYGRTLPGHEEQLGHDHPDTLRVVVNLANVYMSQSRYMDAEGLYKRGIEGYVKHFGPEDLTHIGPAVAQLVNAYIIIGRYDDAKALHNTYFPSVPLDLGRTGAMYPPQGRSYYGRPESVRQDRNQGRAIVGQFPQLAFPLQGGYPQQMDVDPASRRQIGGYPQQGGPSPQLMRQPCYPQTIQPSALSRVAPPPPPPTETLPRYQSSAMPPTGQYPPHPEMTYPLPGSYGSPPKPPQPPTETLSQYQRWALIGQCQSFPAPQMTALPPSSSGSPPKPPSDSGWPDP
ncbi:MAG: hypothetical protein M1839_001434 [Geoglossum umbratile]|nr:MAG: hypothetical protein M1839_001434 [Geoglossum umbratile]